MQFSKQSGGNSTEQVQKQVVSWKILDVYLSFDIKHFGVITKGST